MIKFCGNCEKMCEVVESKEVREYEIKKTKVSAEITILTCKNCGEEVFDRDVEIANDILLFDDYKRKNNLLTSREIAKIREKYGLSQAKFSEMLGFGLKTITRYENGAIQDSTHDNLMRLVDKEDNFLFLQRLSKTNFVKAYKTRKEDCLKQENISIEYEYKKPCNEIYITSINGNGGLTYDGC